MWFSVWTHKSVEHWTLHTLNEHHTAKAACHLVVNVVCLFYMQQNATVLCNEFAISFLKSRRKQ